MQQDLAVAKSLGKLGSFCTLNFDILDEGKVKFYSKQKMQATRRENVEHMEIWVVHMPSKALTRKH